MSSSVSRSLPLFLALAGLAASLRAADAPDNPALWGKAADNKIYAQELVNDVLAHHPELVVFGVHARMPGSDDEKLIACNLDRIGKKDDDDDIAVADDRQMIMSPNLTDPTRFEIQLPLLDRRGDVVGSTGFVFRYHAGDDVEALLHRALAMRADLAGKIVDVAQLFESTDLTSDDSLLHPDASIKIAGAAGKFDFLEVDSINHRLLAAHEKSGTADFIDLNDNQLITRVDAGPAVHIVLDPKTNKYFVSASDEKKVVVLDAATLKEIDEIPMPGELDAILLDPHNHRIFITNDEGSHVWEIDPDADKVVGTIDIPGVPEYMVYDAAANRIYLNLKSINQIAVIDPDAGTIVAQWSTLPAQSPHGLGFDPQTRRLFSAGANGVVAVIDVQTGRVIATPAIARMVDEAAFDSSTRRLYCACTGWMSVVQETDDGAQSLGSVKTCSTAKNVAVDPATHEVWTTYTDYHDSYAVSWRP